MDVDAQAPPVHPLPARDGNHDLLHGLLLHRVLWRAVQQLIRWILGWQHLHSMRVRSHISGDMGSDGSPGGSDAGHSGVLDCADGAHGVAEDTHSTARPLAQASEDDHPAVEHLDELCVVQLSVGPGHLCLSVRSATGDGDCGDHLCEVSLLQRHLHVSIRVLLVAVGTPK